MKEELRIRIRIPLAMVLFLVMVIMFCKYNVESKMGFIVFPIEILLILILFIKRGQRKVNFGLAGTIYLSFMIYRIVISAITTGNLYQGTKKILYYELGVFLFLFMVVQVLNITNVIIAVRNFGIINAFLGVYETFTRSSIFLRFIDVQSRRLITSGLGTNDSRARTIFIHPIICAAFCTFIWCILMYYPLRKRWLNTIAEIAVIICILGTQSRSSWISFFIVSIIIFFQKKIDNWGTLSLKNLAYKGLLILVFAITIFAFRNYFMNALDIIINRWLKGLNTNDVANYNRILMIRNGLKDFDSWEVFPKIFGKGYAYAFTLLQRKSIRGWKGAVDNTYLTILLDYGLIGISYLLFFIIFAFRRIFKPDLVCRVCGLGLLSVFISGFFYDMFYWFTPNFLIALSFGLLLKTEN